MTEEKYQKNIAIREIVKPEKPLGFRVLFGYQFSGWVQGEQRSGFPPWVSGSEFKS